MRAVREAARGPAAAGPPDAGPPAAGRRAARGALAAALAACWIVLGGAGTGAVAAQEQGVVAGTVTDARTLRPIAGAQVAVEGTGIGALSDAQGRFRLQGLTGATAQLRVVMLGYRPVVETVRVGDREVRISATEQAVNLDEIVVTGTPGGTQKRALGNSVAKVNAENLAQIAPAQTLGQLLQGRAPGVVLQQSSGQAGSGGRIRIRGVNSLSLSNEPLLYIDGVRVDNGNRTGPGDGVWTMFSRVNDINPDDIESIEVIKGPAAATLYGTEASNGVIQVITKKGREGRPAVNLSVEQGANWIPDPEGRFATYYRRNADGSIFSHNVVADQTARGRPFFSTGRVQRYTGDVSGGTGGVQYFISAGFDDDEGVIEPNRLRRYRTRGNLTASVSPQLTVGLNLGYQTGRTDVVNEGLDILNRVWWPIVSNPANFAPDGSYAFPTGSPDQIRQLVTLYENVEQYIGGLQLTHKPFDWFTQRLSIGRDRFVVTQNQVIERQSDPDILRVFGQPALGLRRVDGRFSQTTTVDYAGTLTASLPRGIGSKTSVGLQYYRVFNDSSSVIGEEFPGPGVTALSGAARQRVIRSSFDEAITVGTFVQQELSWKDRLFLTGAVRADDNSAFGEDFDLVTYPKFSGAWVVSEESFWPLDVVSTLRLRAAYGQSGKQPVSFAAIQTYSPITARGDVAGVIPSTLGNPELGPERGEEIEAGFEASLFEDRLGIDFTYYDKKTNNVILARGIAPSSGFPGSQPVNIGQVQNTGIELGLRATPWTSRRVRWDLNASVATNDNVITDMGGLPAINAGANQFHREGYPVAAFFGRKVVSAEVVPGANNTFRVTNVMCDGGVPSTDRHGAEAGRRPGGAPVACATAPDVYLGRPTPEAEGAVSSTLTLFGRVTLYGIADFQAGHHWFDWGNNGQCQSSQQCRINVVPEAAMADPILAGEFSFFHFGPGTTVPRSFARVRQLSASYAFPERLLRGWGARSATLTVSARNLWMLWTNYPRGVEPDVGTVYLSGSTQYYINFLNTPQPRFLTAALKVGF